MKIKKSFSRRTIITGGDSFITNIEVEFEIDDIIDLESTTSKMRKLLISDSRKDVKAFFDEAPKNKEIN